MSESDPPIPTLAAPGERSAGAGWILALACVLGLLRFWRLGEWSLWIDEVYTVADWRFSLDRGQIWNPLGYRAIGWTAELLGEPIDELGLRLLPALCGLLCIPAAWWAFRRWIGDRRASLVALLLALSSWHLFWSQNARFYTMAMLVSLIGGGLALRGLHGGKRLPALLGTAVAASAAAFHPTAALIAAGLCVAPWLVHLRRCEVPARFWRVGAAMGILAILAAVAGSHWLWTSLVNHLNAKGTEELTTGPVHLLLTCGYFFTPLLGTAALVGAIWSWRERDARGVLAAGISLGVLGGAIAVSGFVLMTAQYTYCVLPWVMAVAVMPLESVWARSKGGTLVAAWVCVLALPAAADSALYLTARGGERPRWRDAYTWIDERREPGDLVMGMGAPIGEFYLGEANAHPRRTRVVSPLGPWFPEVPRRWNRHGRAAWVVIRPQWLDAMKPDERRVLETWLENEFRLVQRFPVLMEGRDLELLVYWREGTVP